MVMWDNDMVKYGHGHTDMGIWSFMDNDMVKYGHGHKDMGCCYLWDNDMAKYGHCHGHKHAQVLKILTVGILFSVTNMNLGLVAGRGILTLNSGEVQGRKSNFKQIFFTSFSRRSIFPHIL